MAKTQVRASSSPFCCSSTKPVNVTRPSTLEVVALLVQLRPPPAVPDHPDFEVGELLAKGPGRLQHVGDLLVRDEPSENGDGWHGVPPDARGSRRVHAVVDHRDARSWDTELHQLVAGGLRDGDVLRVPIDARSGTGLEPPAEARRPGTVDDGPHLSVHVMHERHHGCTRGQRAQEGHAVLHVHDHVHRPESAEQEVPPGPRQDADLAAPAEVTNALPDLVGRRAPMIG